VFRLTTEAGKPVEIGDALTTFRGEPVTLVALDPPHRPGVSGRVIVRDSQGHEDRYYCTVVGCTYVEINDDDEEDYVLDLKVETTNELMVVETEDNVYLGTLTRQGNTVKVMTGYAGRPVILEVSEINEVTPAAGHPDVIAA
jgi:hypothetical protein